MCDLHRYAEVNLRVEISGPDHFSDSQCNNELDAAVAAERSLNPLAYKSMPLQPHYRDRKPADTVLAEIHARHVRRSDDLGRRQAVDESSEIGLQEVESWYWGGSEFPIATDTMLPVIRGSEQ